MNIGNRYNEYSEKVQETIFLIAGGKKIDDEFVPSLDLLALNYDLLFKAKADIDKNGAYITDQSNRSTKNHQIQTLFSAQNIINQILKSFPTNPTSKARINNITNNVNEDEEDFEDMIDNL